MKNVALITGASSGIGQALARIHAARGGDLVMVARREEKLNELKGELEAKHGVQVLVLCQDLAEQNAAQDIHNAVIAAGIEVEYLINNAGFGGQGKFHDRPLEKDLEMIQVNVVALTALCKLFIPEFIQRNRGRILNVSSIASLTPGPLQAVYFATKAFVTFLSNALAEELSNTPITVTALLPGVTATEFGKVSGMDQTNLFEQAVSAHSVAAEGYAAMLAGQLECLAGVSVLQKMMFAMLPVVPKELMLKQMRKMQEISP